MSYSTELVELHRIYASMINPQVHYDLRKLGGNELSTLDARVKWSDMTDKFLEVIEDTKRLKNLDDLLRSIEE